MKVTDEEFCEFWNVSLRKLDGTVVSPSGKSLSPKRRSELQMLLEQEQAQAELAAWTP